MVDPRTEIRIACRNYCPRQRPENHRRQCKIRRKGRQTWSCWYNEADMQRSSAAMNADNPGFTENEK
jgi:hypothetical protein